MNYYKFVVWFYLYAQALACVINAVRLFAGASQLGMVGSFVAPAGGIFSLAFLSTIVLGLGLVFVALYCIYARGRLAQFKRDAPMTYLLRTPILVAFAILSVLPLLPLTFQMFSLFGGLNEFTIGTTTYFIVGTVPTLLLYGGLLVLQLFLEKLYLDRRSELFVN